MSFPVPTVLTVKPPQAPLTVAVPVHSPSPCVTCSNSSQSSSEGSVASPLSRTPVSSPAIPRTSEDTRGHENTTFSHDQPMLNGSTCLSPRRCNSPQSKFCHCEKLEHDSSEDQVLNTFITLQGSYLLGTFLKGLEYLKVGIQEFYIIHWEFYIIHLKRNAIYFLGRNVILNG